MLPGPRASIRFLPLVCTSGAQITQSQSQGPGMPPVGLVGYPAPPEYAPNLVASPYFESLLDLLELLSAVWVGVWGAVGSAQKRLPDLVRGPT